MGNNRVGRWKVIILISLFLFFAIGAVLIAVYYDALYFALHFRAVPNEYGEYSLVEVRNYFGETLTLPEQTPKGDKITVLECRSPKNCGNRIRTLIIPDSYRLILESADIGLDNLQSVSLGAGIERLYGGLFTASEKLERLSISPENPYLYVSGNCILDRSTQTVVLGCRASVIPAEAVAIGDAAFANLQGLSEIEIPSNIQVIGHSAFWGCKNLKTVVIPSSVHEIGINAFEKCEDLTVCCEASEKPEGWAENWVGSDFVRVVWKNQKE